MKKQIVIACEGAAMANLSDLNELQGDMKTLSVEAYGKLKEEILKTGFAFPLAIWTDSKKKKWIVGGHQRKRALQLLEKEGYEVPKVPIVHVKAENMKAAKRRVFQDIGQYGKLNGQALFDFMEKDFSYEDVYEAFELPNFDMKDFEDEFFTETQSSPPPPAGPDRVTSGAVSDGVSTKVLLYYTTVEYAKVMSAAAQVSAKLKCANLSQLFAKLLEKEMKQ